MLKENLLRLAFAPLVLLALVVTLALSGHALSGVMVAPAQHLMACVLPGPPCI